MNVPRRAFVINSLQAYRLQLLSSRTLVIQRGLSSRHITFTFRCCNLLSPSATGRIPYSCLSLLRNNKQTRSNILCAPRLVLSFLLSSITMASTEDDDEYDYSDDEEYVLEEEDDDMEWNPVAAGSDNPNAPPTISSTYILYRSLRDILSFNAKNSSLSGLFSSLIRLCFCLGSWKSKDLHSHIACRGSSSGYEAPSEGRHGDPRHS